MNPVRWVDTMLTERGSSKSIASPLPPMNPVDNCTLKLSLIPCSYASWYCDANKPKGLVLTTCVTCWAQFTDAETHVVAAKAAVFHHDVVFRCLYGRASAPGFCGGAK